MQTDSQNKEPYRATELRQETVKGLLYTHSRANANTSKTLETASFLYSLIEFMGEKGLITIEELDEHKRVVGERLAKQFRERGMGRRFKTRNTTSTPLKAASR